MIREYFGNLGTGKTFNMSYDAMWWLRKGRRLVSNYEVAFCTKYIKFNETDHTKESNCKYKGDHCWSNFYKDPEEYLWHMIKDDHTLFLIDEASIVLPPRVKVPRQFLHKFLQSRKDGDDLFYTCQVPKYVYGMLRALTNETVRCSTFKAFGMFRKIPYFYFKENKLTSRNVDSMFFMARWYNTNIIEKKMNFYDRKGRDRAWRKRVLSPSQARPVFGCYNTLFKVDFSEDFKIRNGPKRPEIRRSQPTQTRQGIQPNLSLIAEAERVLRDSRRELDEDRQPYTN